MSRVTLEAVWKFVLDLEKRVQRLLNAGTVTNAITDLTGDVTASGPGSVPATIGNDKVTYAKMQNISAASRLLGRGSASGSGDPQEIALGTGLSMSGTTLNGLGSGVAGAGLLDYVAVIKTSDEQVSNNTPQNDNELSFAIGANEKWLVDVVFYVDGPAAADFFCGWTVPTGCGGSNGAIRYSTAATSTGDNVLLSSSSTVITSGRACGLLGVGTAVMVVWKSVIANGATAGTAQVQWSQNTNTAGTVTVFANSYLEARRVS